MKLPKTGKFILIQVIVCLICIELTLQLVHGAYKETPYSIESEPNFCLICHPTRGFGLAPGKFEVAINKKLKFNVSVGQDSFRLTQLAELDTLKTKEVHIHGCSFPFGMGVEDTLNYPYLLQKANPSWNVRNLSVPGNGTLQTLLLLREQIARNELPDAIVLNYASFHLERNVLDVRYRAALHYGFSNANEAVKPLFTNCSFPYAVLSADKKDIQVKYESWDDLYGHWWGRKRLATINFLQSIIEFWGRDIAEMDLITNLIVKEIHEICIQYNIELYIGVLTKDRISYNFWNALEEHGIKSVDLSLKKFYTNLPYDSHPNALGHEVYARRIQNTFNR